MKPSHISLFTGDESCATSTERRPAASSLTAMLIRWTRKLRPARPKHLPIAADRAAPVTVGINDNDHVPVVDVVPAACKENAGHEVPVEAEGSDPGREVEEATVAQSENVGHIVDVVVAAGNADALEVDAANLNHDDVANVSTV